MADMASTDAAFGLEPWGNILHVGMYAIVTAYGTAIYHGTLMEAVGDSALTPHMGNLQRAAVEETGAAGSLLGAVVGIFDHNMDPLNYLPASTTGNNTIAGYVAVADHPDQEYIAQEDGDTSSMTSASIGLNVDMVGTGGSTTTGISTMELDSDTVNTTSTLGLKVIGVHPEDTLSSAGAAGNWCRFIVKMNSAHRGSNIDGV